MVEDFRTAGPSLLRRHGKMNKLKCKVCDEYHPPAYIYCLRGETVCERCGKWAWKILTLARASYLRKIQSQKTGRYGRKK
jgi:hypothetical protein